MICEHCKTEYAPIAYNYGAMHTDQACRDALKSQLATITKRAVDLDHSLGIAQRGWEVAREDAHAFRVERDAAEAKLASAVEGLREIAGRALSYAGWAAECARSTLRALGIDPSKEQGK